MDFHSMAITALLAPSVRWYGPTRRRDIGGSHLSENPVGCMFVLDSR